MVLTLVELERDVEAIEMARSLSSDDVSDYWLACFFKSHGLPAEAQKHLNAFRQKVTLQDLADWTLNEIISFSFEK